VDKKFLELKTRLAEIQDITKTAGLLGWDQRTLMPARGAAVRAEMLASLGKIAHEKFTSDDIGRLLEDLRPYEESLPYESDEASLIRIARKDYQKSMRVPSSLRAEISRLSAQASEIWVQARKKSDYSLFLPYLQRQVELKHQYIECFDETDNAYDILLDDYERGMTTAEVTAMFETLKKDLVPLISDISASQKNIDDNCLHGQFPIETQKNFITEILKRFGFSEDSWRIDPTVHPFASSIATSDIRITTRYYENFLSAALFGSMHECGHGLYENGVSTALERTPLCRGASLGLHESQSRMWENLVGRSRAFWTFFYPRLVAAFPAQLGTTHPETFYRAINKVYPSLIRVEADEATYNLHIILRFELEQEIINGKLALRDLPEAWNARMKSYLGIDVPDDAHGVLQDIHWSSGMMGYFPTYSLGNIISAQIWQRVQAEIPDLQDQFARGEFKTLREWLRERLHRHGRKFTPRETLQKVTGNANIDVGPYTRYLKTKFSDIYNL
jgi:carboxypeptidase Taq